MRKKGVRVLIILQDGRPNNVDFWLKSDVVTPCKVIFNPSSFDL